MSNIADQLLSARAWQLAAQRDERDKWRLIVLDAMLAEWLDALAPHGAPLEHPNRRWHPGDLIDDLQEHRRSIRIEMARLSGPVVIEDCEVED